MYRTKAGGIFFFHKSHSSSMKIQSIELEVSWDANCDFVVNKPTGCDIVLSTMEPFKFLLRKSTLYRITFVKNLRVEIFP